MPKKYKINYVNKIINCGNTKCKIKFVVIIMLKKMLVGLIAGIISGFFSSGGGLILVPAFVYLLKLDEKKARATSLFCILPMVLTTAFFYEKNNFFNWNLGIKCAIGGFIGGIIGAKLLTKISNKYLKIIFVFFLIYAGITMIIK